MVEWMCHTQKYIRYNFTSPDKPAYDGYMLHVPLGNIFSEDEAARQFRLLVERVDGRHELLVVTKNSRPAVAMISVEELERLSGHSVTPVAHRPVGGLNEAIGANAATEAAAPETATPQAAAPISGTPMAAPILPPLPALPGVVEPELPDMPFGSISQESSSSSSTFADEPPAIPQPPVAPTPQMAPPFVTQPQTSTLQMATPPSIGFPAPSGVSSLPPEDLSSSSPLA